MWVWQEQPSTKQQSSASRGSSQVPSASANQQPGTRSASSQEQQPVAGGEEQQQEQLAVGARRGANSQALLHKLEAPANHHTTETQTPVATATFAVVAPRRPPVHLRESLSHTLLSTPLRLPPSAAAAAVSFHRMPASSEAEWQHTK